MSRIPSKAVEDSVCWCSICCRYEFRSVASYFQRGKTFVQPRFLSFQSPDFSFSEFLSVILQDKYCLQPSVLEKFHTNLLEVVNSDVDLLFNYITDTGRFIIEPGAVFGCLNIHRSCPMGEYDLADANVLPFAVYS